MRVVEMTSSAYFSRQCCIYVTIFLNGQIVLCRRDTITVVKARKIVTETRFINTYLDVITSEIDKTSIKPATGQTNGRRNFKKSLETVAASCVCQKGVAFYLYHACSFISHPVRSESFRIAT